MNIVNIPHILSKFVWTRVLTNPIELKREDDFIFGPTGGGYTKRAYLCDKEDGHQYLGENFIPWIIKKEQTFPATSGELFTAFDLFENLIIFFKHILIVFQGDFLTTEKNSTVCVESCRKTEYPKKQPK